VGAYPAEPVDRMLVHGSYLYAFGQSRRAANAAGEPVGRLADREWYEVIQIEDDRALVHRVADDAATLEWIALDEHVEVLALPVQ
jgi:hypothetical protein